MERLSRLTYPECSFEVHEKIACAQFIFALSDGFIKRTLQLKNVSSLRTAMEQAKTIKIVQENSFRVNGDGRSEARTGLGRAKNFKTDPNVPNKFMRKRQGKKRYWKSKESKESDVKW